MRKSERVGLTHGLVELDILRTACLLRAITACAACQQDCYDEIQYG